MEVANTSFLQYGNNNSCKEIFSIGRYKKNLALIIKMVK
jgi:hypothetical protein